MKILIVGLGSIAHKHIAALKVLRPEAEIHALRHSTSSQQVKGIKNIYEISDNSYDFAIISNNTNLHFQWIKLLATLNIPLFIEKPLFSAVGESEKALVKGIVQENLLTYVACNLRFLDCMVEVKRIIHNHRVNEVNSYCGSYLPDWRPNVDFRSVYSANAQEGGGVHMDLIHELDYLFWIFGEPIQVHSSLTNSSSLSISACDYAHYLMSYKDFTVNLTLNYFRRIPKRTFEIVTETSVVEVDLLKNTISIDNVLIFESNQRIGNTYQLQMDNFLRLLERKSSKKNSIEEAYKVLELCLND